MSKSYLDVTHQSLACWVLFWCLWRPGPIGTWWNRQGDRCPWATCFWGSVLVPLGPVSFICISFLLYPQPPTSSLKYTLDKLSDQGMLDSQWLPTQLSWKKRQAWELTACLPGFILDWRGRKRSDELHNCFQQAPCLEFRCCLRTGHSSFCLLAQWRMPGASWFSFPLPEGTEFTLMSDRGWDKPCNPCWGLNCCYKWIVKLLPAAVALGTRAHTGGPSLICSRAPSAHSLSIK